MISKLKKRQLTNLEKIFAIYPFKHINNDLKLQQKITKSPIDKWEEKKQLLAKKKKKNL